MNTYQRSIELDGIATQILDELGMNAVTVSATLRPAVIELSKRAGCQYSTARTVIARHIRKNKGLIVGDYKIIDGDLLSRPPDAEPIPLVIVTRRHPAAAGEKRE